jgi:uncharacterized protein (DUF486 family)
MRTVILLICSNLFMTTAWYWHLKVQGSAIALWVIIGVSWLIALPEYCLAVPANRFGHIAHGGSFTAPQLKVIQEAIAIAVFIAFSLLVLKETPRWQEAAGLVLVVGGLALALSGRPG